MQRLGQVRLGLLSVQTVNAVRDISTLYSLQSVDLHSPDKPSIFLCPPVLLAALNELLISNSLVSLLLKSSHNSFFPAPPCFLCLTHVFLYGYFLV